MTSHDARYPAGEATGDYCRTIETYLCQKNEGHLIRIVGPAFEQVCGWAERGVPLKVAFRGIDRYCERYHAKGGRRRPVRIEFCEPDVLDAFDEWRRAIGVGAVVPESSTASAVPGGRKPGLAPHIERALVRLRSLNALRGVSDDFLRRSESAAGELEALAGEARTARGQSRARIVERLAVLDAQLVAAAVEEIDTARTGRLRKEADAELAPFGVRMTPEARERSLEAAFHRLVRETLGLPTLAYE